MHDSKAQTSAGPIEGGLFRMKGVLLERFITAAVCCGTAQKGSIGIEVVVN